MGQCYFTLNGSNLPYQGAAAERCCKQQAQHMCASSRTALFSTKASGSPCRHANLDDDWPISTHNDGGTETLLEISPRDSANPSTWPNTNPMKLAHRYPPYPMGIVSNEHCRSEHLFLEPKKLGTYGGHGYSGCKYTRQTSQSVFFVHSSFDKV